MSRALMLNQDTWDRRRILEYVDAGHLHHSAPERFQFLWAMDPLDKEGIGIPLGRGHIKMRARGGWGSRHSQGPL